jgi:uncharacterized protein (DUF2252 family)
LLEEADDAALSPSARASANVKLPPPDARSELLIDRQRRKMARSAGTYVRGSTTYFYNWLGDEGRALPQGPSIWICGDCHYGNLGPVANAKGDVAIQIRDLDQTVIGNPAHDLIRLAFSLASAARGFDLPGVVTAQLVEQVVNGYQSALEQEWSEDADKPPLIKGLLQVSKQRSWRHLARERIADLKPSIPLGRRFWPLGADEQGALAELLDEPRVRELVTALHSRTAKAKIDLVDAAYWVKGCSSLGLLRYALLIEIGGGKKREAALLDVKEATAPAAPRTPRARLPKDNAERVVEGARRLAPYLGERMRFGRVLDRSVFVRELMPQDLKLEIEDLQAAEALTVARFLAGVVGRAHGRQMSREERASWAADLGQRRSKTLDAPSWLWHSVVDLMGMHERAYLEHCRRYASVQT